ncbi:MAG: hypothetical protein ABMA64_19365 [Myxococcota bacterium]
MSDDWLWDGTGEPDPDLARWSAALAPLRYRGRPPRSRWPVAAALALAAAALVWAAAPGQGWRCGVDCVLAEGQWLDVGSEPVSLAVADLGTMTVSPNARLRLVETGPRAHRVELAVGHLYAEVDAPPRLLVVDTPGAAAVDLGCAYDLTVMPDGSSLLIVDVGEVSLEGARTAWVPAGAAALTWPGHGPGVPWDGDADPAYADALVAWDLDGQDLLPWILEHSGPTDGVSLWHLVQRAEPPERAQVVERIEALFGPVEPGVAALEPEALRELRDRIVR